MPHFEVALSNHAQRILVRMAQREPALYQRMARALDDVSQDPFQGKALKGKLQGRYSYRIGSYSILYLIRQSQLLVIIIDSGGRVLN